MFTFFPAFSCPKGWGSEGFIYLFVCLFSYSHLGTSGNTAGFKITTLGLGPCLRCQHLKTKQSATGTQTVRLGWVPRCRSGVQEHLAVHTLIWQLLRPPKHTSQMLPRFPAYNLNNDRPRLITWDCSNAQVSLSLFLAYRDATLFSWRGLNGEPIRSWAVI